MSAAVILDYATLIALGMLVLALLLSGVRFVLGPSLADRVLALDTMTTLALGVVCVLAIRSGHTLYLDIAIAIALVGFLSTVALARYLALRGEGAVKDQR